MPAPALITGEALRPCVRILLIPTRRTEKGGEEEEKGAEKGREEEERRGVKKRRGKKRIDVSKKRME